MGNQEIVEKCPDGEKRTESLDELSARIAHLTFIQNVIGRMAANSFYLKGWSVAIVAGVFTLATKDADGRFLYAGVVPLIAFWILDAYFLRQEKTYRLLYEKVAKNQIASAHFTMDGRQVSESIRSMYLLLFSPTLLWFYAPLLAITMCFLYFKLSL